MRKEEAAETQRARSGQPRGPQAPSRSSSMRITHCRRPATRSASTRCRGLLDVRFDRDRRLTHTPQEDGLPALKGGRIVQARAGGGVVAAIVSTPRQTILQWFSKQEGCRDRHTRSSRDLPRRSRSAATAGAWRSVSRIGVSRSATSGAATSRASWPPWGGTTRRSMSRSARPS